MESELHKMLRELLGDAKAAEIMGLIKAESDARVEMLESAVNGWRRRVAELQDQLALVERMRMKNS